MKRFMLALALVAVAGATYVATAPGGQTAGPTAAQFKALTKKVAKLQKQVNRANSGVNDLVFVVGQCMLNATVGVVRRGDPGGTFGYTYTDGGSVYTTALDLSLFPTDRLLTLNPDPDLHCDILVGPSGVKRHGLAQWAKLHR
jgi:hypothetical protein